MERALVFSGLGGQGVQLAGRTLGRAALYEARSVLVFGTYGGEMRGGDTDVTLVIGDSGPLVTPPVIDTAWAALVMHHNNWPEVRLKVDPTGLVLVDSSVFRGELDFPGTVVRLDASRLAAEQVNRRAGSMVALGGFCAATGLVSLEALLVAAAEVLPPYRSEFLEANRAALRLGFEAVGDVRSDAGLRMKAAA